MCIGAIARAVTNMGHLVTVLHFACATSDITFRGLSVSDAQAYAAIMAVLEFDNGSVETVDEYLSA